MPDDSPYWTPKEAAAFLRRSTTTLRRMVKENRLTRVTINGRPVYLRDEVRASVVVDVRAREDRIAEAKAYGEKIRKIADKILAQHGHVPRHRQHKPPVKIDNAR